MKKARVSGTFRKPTVAISKPIIYIAMIYILILFASAVLGNKMIRVPVFGAVSAGSLTGPFWFLLSDIIAEVYSYDLSRAIFIAAMVCELVFIAITEFLLHLPSPSWWHYQSAYNYVEGPLFLIYVCQFIGISIAWYINVKLLTRWKTHFLNANLSFPLRSIGASGIGEIIFSVISVGLSSIGFVPLPSLYKVVLGSCCSKLLFSLLFAYPAVFVVILLRRLDDVNNDQNPHESIRQPRLKSKLPELGDEYVIS